MTRKKIPCVFDVTASGQCDLVPLRPCRGVMATLAWPPTASPTTPAIRASPALGCLVMRQEQVEVEEVEEVEQVEVEHLS